MSGETARDVLGGALLRGDDLPRHARVVIVGGGLAGLELAKELDRGGCADVLVLEAGPVADLRHVNVSHDDDTATRMCFEPPTDDHFHRPFESASDRHYTWNSGLRRRLGGRSMYWHGVVLPLEPWALAEPWWPGSIVRDLTGSWRSGPSLYSRVMSELEEWQGKGQPRFDTAGRTLSIGDHELSATPMACRAAPDGRWYAYSPLDHWLNEPRSGNVRFACDTEVLAVDVRDGRATGVLVSRRGTNDVVRIEADVVALCTGTVENTRLAIQALTESGELAEPRLGGMTDHIVQGFVLKLVASSVRGRDYLRRTGSYVAEASARTRSYLRFDVHRPAQDEVVVDVRATGEQMCQPDSYVRCEKSGSYPWCTVVHTSMCPQDHEVVDGQREMLREFWQALAVDLGLPGTPLDFEKFEHQQRTNTFVLPEFAGAVPAGQPETWVSLLGTEDHEGGTLPLGSVLDERHQVVGVANLFAAGPATFPRLGSANPSLTTFALAHRLAAILAEAVQLGSGGS